MASPQIEKGYTRIANELIERIVQVGLNGTQYRIIMTIWRYTYGIKGQKSNELSVRFLSEKINANKRQTERELAVLMERNIVKTLGVGEKGARVLQVNKNYEQWDKDPVKQQGPEPQSNVKPKYDEENTYYKMAIYFYKRVEKVAQDAGIQHLIKKSNMQTWADDMRKLVELDQVTKVQAKEVMDWVTKDPFWRTNILSAKKLRQKFMELAIKMNADKQPKTKQKEIQKDSRDKEIALQKWIAEGNDPDAFNWSD